MKRYYTLKAVENYLNKTVYPELNATVVCLPEALLDTYCITWNTYQGEVVEVLKARAISEWSSVYTRHIFRKKAPKWIFDYLNDYIQDLESEGIEEESEASYMIEDIENLKDTLASLQ